MFEDIIDPSELYDKVSAVRKALDELDTSLAYTMHTEKSPEIQETLKTLSTFLSKEEYDFFNHASETMDVTIQCLDRMDKQASYKTAEAEDLAEINALANRYNKTGKDADRKALISRIKKSMKYVSGSEREELKSMLKKLA